jgi:riboflavin kinase / FMN adenylyltransferase
METLHLTYPLEAVQSFPPAALAIGYFDGVHRGHQAVIAQARRLAEKHGAVLGVMTFHPHPREVLGKGEMTQYLTPLPEKLKQFERLGVERTYVMRFDRDFAGLTEKAFVNEVLLPLQVKGAAVGFNFTFGRGAAGKAQDLVRLGAGLFDVEVAEPIHSDGLPLSSTRLRQALAEGDVEEARKILGRHYTIRGRVVQGDQRGRKIGYPTANLSLEGPYHIPAHGVYIVQVEGAGKPRYGVMNIGVRPTFHDPEPRLSLEVHLLDTQENLYGRTLQVAFLRFLRPEKRFDSVTALVGQIRADERQAREWLKGR